MNLRIYQLLHINSGRKLISYKGVVEMTILEYLYNLISIVCVIDLLYCYHIIRKDKFIVKQYGLDKISKIKLLVEKIIIFIYILYLLFNIVMFIVK